MIDEVIVDKINHDLIEDEDDDEDFHVFRDDLPSLD
jgi:hypothetical protein